MSHATIFRASQDPSLTNRVVAAVQKEAIANAELGSTPFGQDVIANPAEGIRLAWPVAIDYEDEYSYAIDNGNPDPGGDPSVITDANISAAVQAHWPQDTASP